MPIAVVIDFVGWDSTAAGVVETVLSLQPRVKPSRPRITISGGGCKALGCSCATVTVSTP